MFHFTVHLMNLKYEFYEFFRCTEYGEISFYNMITN